MAHLNHEVLPKFLSWVASFNLATRHNVSAAIQAFKKLTKEVDLTEWIVFLGRLTRLNKMANLECKLDAEDCGLDCSVSFSSALNWLKFYENQGLQ